jgi:phosphoserine phosphatase
MVTASFDFYARRLGESLGFDDVIATYSKWDSAGRLTSGIEGNNCYGPAKLERVNAYMDRWEQRPYTVAYTDHHSDASLLASVDQPVVVNPKRTLRDIAVKEGYEIQDWEVA